MAHLATAAARYVALGPKRLDATVANPRMFPKSRRRAREALKTAISQLHDNGPEGAAERELLQRVTELCDGVIAAVVTRFSETNTDGGGSAPVQCARDGTIGKTHRLRDAYDRLQKIRRTVLDNPAFAVGQGHG